MKKIKFPLIILFCIFIFALALMVFSLRADSVTTDEGIHLFAGYTYIIRGDFRLDPEHPPLLKEIAALPLIFFKNLKVPLDGLWDKAANFYYDSWQETRILSQQFLFSLGNNAEKLIFWGRFPFIILTLVLGLAVYLWARKLYGEKAGIFAAFLILFLPNILAHGRLINTDLGLTLFFFLALYFWIKFLKKPNWLAFLFSGLFVGLAFASKFTSVLLIPILAILALAKVFFFDKDLRRWSKYLLGLLGIMIIGLMVTWATYGFSIDTPPKPIDSLSANINLWTNFDVPATIDEIFTKIRPIMFPADLYKGFFLVGRHALAGHGSFLLGETSNTGWWYYFPVAIFYKTPIPFFIFLILAIMFWRKLKTKENFDEFALLLTPIIFLVLSMFSKADLGVRHILPIFPFLAVLASKSINIFNFKKITHLIIFGLLILWYLYSAVASYPNYLAYFNEFAGGSNKGYKILVDSNLDWGQDVFRIKKYLDEHNITDGYILYPWDGDEALRYYGINLKPFPWDDKTVKGYVVISATYYQLADLRWLDSYPREQITSGVFIFELD